MDQKRKKKPLITENMKKVIDKRMEYDESKKKEP